MAKKTQARSFGPMSGQRYGSFVRPTVPLPARIKVTGGGRQTTAVGGGRPKRGGVP